MDTIDRSARVAGVVFHPPRAVGWYLAGCCHFGPSSSSSHRIPSFFSPYHCLPMLLRAGGNQRGGDPLPGEERGPAGNQRRGCGRLLRWLPAAPLPRLRPPFWGFGLGGRGMECPAVEAERQAVCVTKPFRISKLQAVNG